jgi:D-serine deaminase-like pyridoxal phosphate-dependent protein
MIEPHPGLGLPISQIPTPSLILDLDVFDDNCRTIAEFLVPRNVEWRPHIKGHKSPALARRMLEAGASGVTCAKVSEAEIMASAGIGNILVANQPATLDAWRRVARLQGATWVGVAIDSVEHVDIALKAGAEAGVTIPLVIEVDIGMNRAGVHSPEEAVAVASYAVQVGADFAGVMGYEGHLLTVWPLEDKQAAIGAAVGKVAEAAEAIRASSIPVGIVSCGGSGSYEISSQIDGVTEIQAGGGCLMDRFYRESCHVDLRNALFVVASVSSRPAKNKAILDAGWKAIPDRLGIPRPRDLPDVEVAQLYAEHARLEWTGDFDPPLGERVVLIPGYSDATTVLHDEFLGVRDGVVVEVIPLSARGALR